MHTMLILYLYILQRRGNIYVHVFTSVLKFWNYKSCKSIYNFPKNQLGESQLKQMCKQHSTYHQFNLILQFSYIFFFQYDVQHWEKIIPDAAGRNTCCVQVGWWWVHKGNAIKEGERLTLWHSDMKFWSSLISNMRANSLTTVDLLLILLTLFSLNQQYIM